MVEIKSRDEFRTWLQGKPRDVAVGLAARAALRLLPFVAKGTKRTEEGDRLLLASCRSLAIVWTAAYGCNQDAAAAAAADAAADAARAAVAARAADSADAARAADAAAYAADAAYAANAAAYAAAAADAAADAVDAAWSDLSVDADAVSKGEPLNARPLFNVAWHSPLDDAIDALKALRNANGDWSFWLRWYDDRLRGAQADLAFETAVLALSDEDWKNDVSVVNAQLAELYLRYAEQPAVSSFSVSNNQITGRLYPLRAANDTALEGVASEARHAAERLRSQLSSPDFMGNPIADDVCDTLDRMLSALSAGADAPRFASLLPILETFAANRRSARDPKDNARLPDRIAELLDALDVQTRQVLAFFEDAERIVDRADGLGLSIEDNDRRQEALDTVVDAARQSNEVAASAVAALEEGRGEIKRLYAKLKELEGQNTQRAEEERISLQTSVKKNQAYAVRSQENLGRTILAWATSETLDITSKVYKRGKESFVKDAGDAAGAGAVALLVAMVHPLAGLAVFAGSALKRTVESLRELKQELPDPEEEGS